MLGPNNLELLRHALPGFAHLPDRIEAPWRRISALKPMPISEATIDDLAFAIAGWRSRLDHMQAAVAALEELYHLARKAGCQGTDSAMVAVLKGKVP